MLSSFILPLCSKGGGGWFSDDQLSFSFCKHFCKKSEDGKSLLCIGGGGKEVWEAITMAPHSHQPQSTLH